MELRSTKLVTNTGAPLGCPSFPPRGTFQTVVQDNGTQAEESSLAELEGQNEESGGDEFIKIFRPRYQDGELQRNNSIKPHEEFPLVFGHVLAECPQGPLENSSEGPSNSC